MWVQHKNQKSIDEINVTAALSTAINHTSNYASAEEKFNMSIENVPILWCGLTILCWQRYKFIKINQIMDGDSYLCTANASVNQIDAVWNIAGRICNVIIYDIKKFLYSVWKLKIFASV